jgi:hypothetical protein
MVGLVIPGLDVEQDIGLRNKDSFLIFLGLKLSKELKFIGENYLFLLIISGNSLGFYFLGVIVFLVGTEKIDVFIFGVIFDLRVFRSFGLSVETCFERSKALRYF